MRLTRKQKIRRQRRARQRGQRSGLRAELLESRQLLTTWFVDADMPTGSGTSWADPFADLQDAVAVSTAGDEIWVAEGTYQPGTNRHASFHMKPDVDWYGGFQGVSVDYPLGESSPDQRSWSSHRTILSGDVANDDVYVLHGPGDTYGVEDLLMQINNNEENNHHVVSGAQDARLDGFYVEGGNSNGLCSSPATPVSICHLASYWPVVYEHGGGLFAPNGTPMVENVVFRFNSAIQGGGVYTEGSSLTSLDEPNFRNVVFHNNLAEQLGAGMYNNGSDVYLENAVFHKNHVVGVGGIGGGLMISGGDTLIVNSTVYGNWSHSGGGVAVRTADAAIINSIVHGNGAIVVSGTEDVFHAGGGQVFAAHSNFGMSLPSTVIDGGGLNYDFPYWAAPDTAEGPDNTWVTDDDGLLLNDFSVCHDTGTSLVWLPNGLLVEAPEDDILGNLRVDPSNPSDGIDMGAYEVGYLPVVIGDPDPGPDPNPPIDSPGRGGWNGDWMRYQDGERDPDQRKDSRHSLLVESLVQGKEVPVDRLIEGRLIEPTRLEKEVGTTRVSKDEFFHRLGLAEFMQLQDPERFLDKLGRP